MVYTEHAPKRQQFYLAQAMSGRNKRCKYTTSVGTPKRDIKKLQLLIQNRIIIIIIMEICKAPTLRLKALNKHTHIMYIEMENVIKKKY